MLTWPKHRFACVTALIFSVLLTGCYYVHHDRPSLNKFAANYIALRKAVNDSEVLSWVITLDQSERTDGSNGTSYRRYFAGALDVKASNRHRADSARQAMDYYDNNSTKMMDDFDSHNGAADQKSLALVESANTIRNENYRQQAVAIAGSARKIQRTFDALRENYVNTYDLQVVLLKAIANENGDLGRVFSLMQQKIPEKKRLESEADKLRRDEQASVQQLQEQYAAFKGITGITLDYVEPAPKTSTSSR